MSGELEQRVYRLEEIVGTLAAWLVGAQTGFGKHDYGALNRMITESREKYENDRLMAAQDGEE